MHYQFKNENGHIEVWIDGEFAFSSDTMREAYQDVIKWQERYEREASENDS